MAQRPCRRIALAALLLAASAAAAGEPAASSDDTRALDALLATEIEGASRHLERALDQSGFLRHEAMRPAMVNNLRALLQRATMTEQEVRTFHGVIKFLSKSKHEE